jgi:hypothetical protein
VLDLDSHELSSTLSIWGGSWRQRKVRPFLVHEFATGFTSCGRKHRHAKTPTRHSVAIRRFK